MKFEDKKIRLSEPIIDDQDISAVVEVLKGGWLVQGPKVREFEDRFAAYVGVKYAVALNSATSGLHLALLSLGIGAGDEVIVPVFTWVATANAVELCGAKPIFVDIELESYNTTVEKILAKITPATKAIIPVHLFGKPFDIELLKKSLPRFIPIIEDAACAAGAKINNNYCGSMGEIGVFSFHPRKSITTGEGGMLVTNDEDIYRKVTMLRNHGQDTFNIKDDPSFMADCPVAGFNYRMTDLQGALGVTQLKKLDSIIQYRNKLAGVYHGALASQSGIALPTEDPNTTHAWQAYVIILDSVDQERKDIMLRLKERGIETRPGTHAVHELSFYKTKYNMGENDFPNGLKAFRKSISLPFHNKMSADECQYVAQTLRDILHA